MDTMIRSDVRHEMLRIAGKKVETQDRLEVRFPWDKLAWSAAYRAPRRNLWPRRSASPTLMPADAPPAPADLAQDGSRALVARKRGAGRLITLEIRALPEGPAARGWRAAFDVFTFAGQLCLLDDARPSPASLTRTASRARSSPCANRSMPSRPSRPSTPAEHGGAQLAPAFAINVAWC
jgi:hypothetical protein